MVVKDINFVWIGWVVFYIINMIGYSMCKL